MIGAAAVTDLAARLRAARGLAAKRDIARVAGRLGLAGAAAVPVGDDCAAIPDGDGFLLFAIEGFMNAFVAGDPWFAGWCGVMVNLSDVAAMGGRPIAVVDALWAAGEAGAEPVLRGLRDASERYGVPIVGGHSNLAADRAQLSVAVLGRARRLLSSFAAEPGDVIVAAVDRRGRYRGPFANFEAATDAPVERLRADLALLPEIAEAGLSRAAKDISQAGLVGTLLMFAEASGVGAVLDLAAVLPPAGVAMERWLLSFPSYGYLLAAKPGDAAAIVARFAARGITAAVVGAFEPGGRVDIAAAGERETIWDFSREPLTGCRPAGGPRP